MSIYVNVNVDDEDVDEPSDNILSDTSNLDNMQNDQNVINVKEKLVDQNRQLQNFQQKKKSK